MNPEVSVIIINYNTFDLTIACIESVLGMVSETPIEIILVDNASVEKNPEEFKMRFPSIHLIKNSVNVGFAAGNNIGLRHASGKFVLLLNSDTKLLNDAVTIVRNFLEDHPNVGAAAGQLLYPDGAIQHNCQRFPSVKYKLFEFLRLQKIFKRAKGKILYGSFFDHDTVAYPDWIWGTFFMFRRGVVQRLEDRKLKEIFFMYVEDTQWCMEFKRIGYDIAFVPDAKVVHYIGKSGGNRSELMFRNHQIFMKLYYNSIERKIIGWLDYLLRKNE